MTGIELNRLPLNPIYAYLYTMKQTIKDKVSVYELVLTMEYM